VIRLLNDKSGCCYTSLHTHHIRIPKLSAIFFSLSSSVSLDSDSCCHKMAFINNKCLASLLPTTLLSEGDFLDFRFLDSRVLGLEFRIFRI
jgi:hypothetical protein